MHGEQRARRARRKRDSLNHTHVTTLVNTRIGGCLVGNTEVLRNHTANGKHSFNVVCHLLMAISALRICTAALLRFICLLPGLAQLPFPTCHVHAASISTNRANRGQGIEGITSCPQGARIVPKRLGESLRYPESCSEFGLMA